MKDSVKYPKDYEKSVGRVRYGYDEKIKKKTLLDYVNRGEMLEFRRAQPFNPPRCADNYKVKLRNEPFIYLNINVNAGKKGTIGLRIDDDPENKAEEFATEFQLEVDDKVKLAELFEEYIQSEIQKQKNQG